MDTFHTYERACGSSLDAAPHILAMKAWLKDHPHGEAILNETIAYVQRVAPLLNPPSSKLCDPDSDWYRISLMVANLLRPEERWWVVQYMAPFARMGLCGKVFFACRTTGRILFGVRNVPGEGKGMLDTTAGNWEYGEKAFETAEREAGDEIAHAIPFSLKGRRPIFAEVMYSDYGGEKGRAYTDTCYVVLVDEEFTPPITDEMAGWTWETRDTIIGTGRLVFEGVNAPPSLAAFAFVERQNRLRSLLETAARRRLEPDELAQLNTLCLED